MPGRLNLIPVQGYYLEALLNTKSTSSLHHFFIKGSTDYINSTTGSEKTSEYLIRLTIQGKFTH